MIPANAKECEVQIGDKVFPGYLLTNEIKFQGGVDVKELLDAMARKFAWDSVNFKAVIK